jgi:hypothetical protein
VWLTFSSVLTETRPKPTLAARPPRGCSSTHCCHSRRGAAKRRYLDRRTSLHGPQRPVVLCRIQRQLTEWSGHPRHCSGRGRSAATDVQPPTRIRRLHNSMRPLDRASSMATLRGPRICTDDGGHPTVRKLNAAVTGKAPVEVRDKATNEPAARADRNTGHCAEFTAEEGHLAWSSAAHGSAAV